MLSLYCCWCLVGCCAAAMCWLLLLLLLLPIVVRLAGEARREHTTTLCPVHANNWKRKEIRNKVRAPDMWMCVFGRSILVLDIFATHFNFCSSRQRATPCTYCWQYNSFRASFACYWAVHPKLKLHNLRRLTGRRKITRGMCASARAHVPSTTAYYYHQHHHHCITMTTMATTTTHNVQMRKL